MGQEKAEGSGSNDDQKKKTGNLTGKLWVPIVIFAGTLLGILSYELATEISGFPRFDRFGQSFGPDVFLEFHIILSTIGMALLVALIVVYARTYIQTKANFILGLLVVLFALLLQALLTYPVLLELETGFAIEVFSPVADAFSIIAYTVFLYLSLE
jgi:hypothetical protein